MLPFATFLAICALGSVTPTAGTIPPSDPATKMNQMLSVMLRQENKIIQLERTLTSFVSMLVNHMTASDKTFYNQLDHLERKLDQQNDFMRTQYCLFLGGSVAQSGKCYRFVANKMTWEKASNECRWNGRGALVSIQSKAKDDLVQEVLKSQAARIGKQQMSVWTGGNDEKKRGEWVWTATGEKMGGFTKWQKDQPDLSKDNERCLAVTNHDNSADFEWHDYPCSDELYALCEYNMS